MNTQLENGKMTVQNARCDWQRCYAMLAVLMAVGLNNRCGAQQELDSFSFEAVKHAVNEAQKCAVQIETSGGRKTTPGSSGVTQPVTGTIVDDQGHIVAAAASFLHEPAAIMVRDSNGKQLPAKMIARNDARQIVMLEIVDFDSSMSETFAKAVPATELRVGQTAIAVGKVFDPAEGNVSVGIVSAPGRIDGVTLQTDAKVSANNYGGPLVNLDGHVLGVLVPREPGGETAAAGIGWYDSGIGFAVPLDAMRLDEMIAGQSFRPGQPGIQFDESDGVAAQAIVTEVVADSPAENAGITKGDLVTAIDSQPIELLAELQNRIDSMYAGDKVTLTVKRDDKSMTMDVVLGEPSAYQ